MSAAHIISKVEGRKAGSGFTLTELLVSLLVGVLVLTGVHSIFMAGIATQNTTSLQTEVNRKAQVGLDSIVSKLRGSSGVVNKLSSNSNRILLVDQDDRDCSFWISNGSLYRRSGAGAGTFAGGVRVATDVKTLQFIYRDRAGATVTPADLAYSVIVLLEIERARHSARLQSTVRLRNK